MKKIISIILVLAFLMMTTFAFAGGDKRRGSKGKGDIVRTQTTGRGQ